MLSDSGWTDNELCEIWFCESFIPNVVARCVDDKKPIVLTYDGHESHETSAIKRLAYDNNIILFCLPSKTTHKLQPLDVSMFSVLQCTWNVHCGDLAAKSITINRYNFIPEYLAVWEKVITWELIIKVFCKTGIYPFNPSIILDHDFRPSMALSTTLRLPSSYPNLIPSSPPAIPTDDEDSDDDFIPGHSSNVEMASGDDDDSGNEGHGDDEDFGCDEGCVDKDNFGCDKRCEDVEDFRRISIDKPQPPSLLNSDTLHTTLTENRHITDRAHLECLTSPLPDHLPVLSMPLHMSLATPLSSVAPPNIPDWDKSFGQIVSEKNAFYSELLETKAQLRAGEAHCTIMAQALEDANAQIANMSKKKTQGTTKIKARWVMLPELKDIFEAEEANQKEQEWCNAEKEAQKQADHLAHQS